MQGLHAAVSTKCVTIKRYLDLTLLKTNVSLVRLCTSAPSPKTLIFLGEWADVHWLFLINGQFRYNRQNRFFWCVLSNGFLNRQILSIFSSLQESAIQFCNLNISLVSNPRVEPCVVLCSAALWFQIFHPASWVRPLSFPPLPARYFGFCVTSSPPSNMAATALSFLNLSRKAANDQSLPAHGHFFQRRVVINF